MKNNRPLEVETIQGETNTEIRAGGELIKQLWPEGKVLEFEVGHGGRWEAAHKEFGDNIGDFIHRLNELQNSEHFNLLGYVSLFDEASTMIDSLVNSEFLDDPISIQADPRYDYMWSNTHKNVATALVNKATSLSEHEKSQVTHELLDFVMNKFGRLPIEVESDRLRDVFWAVENTWCTTSAQSIAQFYESTCKNNVNWQNLEISDLVYGHKTTYDGEIQSQILLSLECVLDSKLASEGNKDIISLVFSMMDGDVKGKLDDYTRVIEKLGVNNVIAPLLENLKSDDQTRKRLSAEILFRLELGKIGITEQGAEYLGRLYDLGKLNDPDFFVRRLDYSGTMAIISPEEGIKGLFGLDLASREETVISEVRQMVTTELFLPRADETIQQKVQREEYLQLFIKNYENIFNDPFFKNSGIRVNSLDLHEQGWFLLYYLELSQKGDKDGIARLQKFTKKYGEHGIKSFLALEYGGSGQEIFDFAESTNLTEPNKALIFKNFSGIAHSAYFWRRLFEDLSTEKKHHFAAQVHEAFIRKNTEFFRAAAIIGRGEGGDVSLTELIQSMNAVTTALESLKLLTSEKSRLKLEGRPRHQNEVDYSGSLIEGASSSYTLVDSQNGDRIVISLRPVSTAREGAQSYGGEARVNFSFKNGKTKETVRIGFDLNDHGSPNTGEDRVGLDLGIGVPDHKNKIWPSQRVGRVLSLVTGSEGGHAELPFSPNSKDYFAEIVASLRDFIESKFE